MVVDRLMQTAPLHLLSQGVICHTRIGNVMNISYNFQWNISIINYHTSFFLLRNVIYTSCKQNREKNEKTYTSLQVINTSS